MNARVISGAKVETKLISALMWVDAEEVKYAWLALVPIEADGGVALVLVSPPSENEQPKQQPLLALDRDGARILLEELMRHVRLDGAQ